MSHSISIGGVGRIIAVTLGGLATQFAYAGGGYHDLGLDITVSGTSANGGVAAGYGNGSFYAWTAAGGLTSIGGRWEGGVASVSWDGTLIAGSAAGANGNTQAALYNVASGTWTTLGGIGGVSGTSESAGWNIAGNGTSLVGLGWINGGTAHAVQSTTAGGLHDLGALGGSSRADGVSFDGSIVAGWQETASGFWQGSYWNHGVATLMVDGNGDVLSQANAVSADGSWVIGEGGAGGGGESWRYNTFTGATEYLGDYDPFSEQNNATGISADGRIIVGYDRTFGPAQFGTGTIWIEGDGMRNLTDYVSGMGVNLNGRTLALPMGVSADGLTVYGLDSERHGFVVSLAPAVPEPSTYAMLGAGLLGVLLARRRKARLNKHSFHLPAARTPPERPAVCRLLIDGAGVWAINGR